MIIIPQIGTVIKRKLRTVAICMSYVDSISRINNILRASTYISNQENSVVAWKVSYCGQDGSSVSLP